MKLDIFLFCFALILAFLSGNITYFIKSEDHVDFEDIEEIRKLHFELQDELKPNYRLDLNSDYPTKEHYKLLEVPTTLGTSRNRIFLNSSDCFESKIQQLSSKYVNKNTLWLGHLCNQIEHLPKNFFDSPPYIYKNGSSFAYMKYKMIRSHFERVRWLEKYNKFMHVTELRDIGWAQNATQRFLIKQNNEVLNRVLKGENIFLTDKYYFIKNGDLKYFVIDINRVSRFFKHAKYRFSMDKNKCNIKIGNVCWYKRPYALKNIFSQSIMVVFLVTIIILLLTANSLYGRIKRKRLEEERKKHALRILTHELRTPIASLLLQVDHLNKSQDCMSDDFREQLSKIEGQVYRLKHLAQKSQSYLQTNDANLININLTHIPSLKSFIEDIVFEYDKNSIHLEITEDFSIQGDHYWLNMCITNLIENAFRYGKSPIEIIVRKKNKHFDISIVDQGHIPFTNIKDLLKSKHQNSKGLGLGIIIVNKTIKEMGGKLTLDQNPTTFTIHLPLEQEKPHENTLS